MGKPPKDPHRDTLPMSALRVERGPFAADDGSEPAASGSEPSGIRSSGSQPSGGQTSAPKDATATPLPEVGLLEVGLCATNDVEAEQCDPGVLGQLALVFPADQRCAARSGSSYDGPQFCRGELFHDYLLGGEFARGGLSLLYEAEHTATGQICLIKVLKPGFLLPQYASVQDKLFAEGELLMLAGPDVPFLVTVHGCGRDARLGPWVVMDKLEGRTLEAYMREQRARGVTLSPESVIGLGIKLAEALHTMHFLGAVHRDLKPANIFLVDQPDGSLQVVLLDWGCAKTRHAPDTGLEENTLGTAAYMAPEQPTGGCSGAVDQYALAVILVEMLWRHIFIDDFPVDGQALLLRHAHLAVPDAPSYAVPPLLWEILKRALAKSPGRRFDSCTLFAEALRGWLRAPDLLSAKPRQLLVPTRETQPSPGRLRTPSRVSQHAITDVATPATRITLQTSSPRPSLVIRSGADLGARFELEDRHVIGSHAALAHIVINDAGISGKHASLEAIVRDGSSPVYSVLDMDSLNGTAVGGVPLGGDSRPLHQQVATLTAGAELMFGKVHAALLPAGRLGPGDQWQTPAQAAAFDQARDAALEAAIQAQEAHQRAQEAAHQRALQAYQRAQEAHQHAQEAHQRQQQAPTRRWYSTNPMGDGPVASPFPQFVAVPPAPPPPPPPVLLQPVLLQPPQALPPQPAVKKPYRPRVAMSELRSEPTFLIMWSDQAIRLVPGSAGVIGGAPEHANIVIDEEHVSRAHLHYKYVTGATESDLTFAISDLDSSNGVTSVVAGVHRVLKAGVLRPGDRVWLGGFVELAVYPPGSFVKGKFVPKGSEIAPQPKPKPQPQDKPQLREKLAPESKPRSKRFALPRFTELPWFAKMWVVLASCLISTLITLLLLKKVAHIDLISMLVAP